MRIVDFFSLISSGVRPESSVFCFVAKKEYPIQFFAQVRERITFLQKTPFYSIDIEALTFGDIERALTTSLLGMHAWYWLCDISELDIKKKEKLFLLLQSYRGPHIILFFIQRERIPEEIPSSIVCVEIPDQLSKLDSYEIAKWLDFTSAPLQLVDLLYQHAAVQSLDTLCMGLWYLALAGTVRANFIREQLDLVLEPQVALFGLTTDFFSKKPSAFFSSWRRIKDQYSLPFWTTFWVEQIWRAYFYAQYMRIGDRIEAKKISFRLPFSYINTDWKRYKADYLKQACTRLYEIELKTKFSGDGSELDLFFSQFLQGQ